jgi:ZIP family zinc transporter
MRFMGFPMAEADGIKASWHRSVLWALCITLHNIPKGLAVGAVMMTLDVAPG